MKTEEIYKFWEERAGLGFKGGTNDNILKQLEIKKISEFIHDGIKVLDAGCGNGITAIELAKQFEVDITALDYSKKMIEYAKKNMEEEFLKGTIIFDVKDIKNIDEIKDKYDLIYTERVLINLQTWEEQKAIIEKILKLLKTDGLYLMCENSQDALDRLNEFRTIINLVAIEVPWHNCYLKESEVESAVLKNGEIIRIENFTSTYYFLSRVINAWQAKKKNREPSYDAPINKLAFSLPLIGDVGQTKLWVWKRI